MLLTFLYLGTLTLTQDNVFDFLTIAVGLELNELAESCTDVIQRQ